MPMLARAVDVRDARTPVERDCVFVLARAVDVRDREMHPGTVCRYLPERLTLGTGLGYLCVGASPSG